MTTYDSQQSNEMLLNVNDIKVEDGSCRDVKIQVEILSCRGENVANYQQMINETGSNSNINAQIKQETEVLEATESNQEELCVKEENLTDSENADDELISPDNCNASTNKRNIYPTKYLSYNPNVTKFFNEQTIHTGEKLFSCNVCSYKSRKKSNTKSHVVRHMGEKRFVCRVCLYETFNKCTLIIHERTHTGKKPFTCDFTTENPFSCKFCDFKASQKIAIDGHMRSHTKEKPLACNRCKFRCSYKWQLEVHQFNHK